jgi:hypothetical protein
MIGPEANELVLFNKDKIFSSEAGLDPVLDLLFPRGLMLMDFEEHRIHRKTLSVAFKTRRCSIISPSWTKASRADWPSGKGAILQILSGDQGAHPRSGGHQLPGRAVGAGSDRRSTRPSATWCGLGGVSASRCPSPP